MMESRDAQRVMGGASDALPPVTFLSYAPMGIAGIFKDLIDWIGIGSIPGIGTVVTFCASILIFFSRPATRFVSGKNEISEGHGIDCGDGRRGIRIRT